MEKEYTYIQVDNYQVNRKYTIKITRAAGVKTGDGYEIEAHSDSIEEVESDARQMRDYMESLIPKPVATVETKESK